jgi:hypothetical protein
VQCIQGDVSAHTMPYSGVYRHDDVAQGAYAAISSCHASAVGRSCKLSLFECPAAQSDFGSGQGDLPASYLAIGFSFGQVHSEMTPHRGRRSITGLSKSCFYTGCCCEMTKGHSDLVGHHLLYCLLDAMYDPFMLLPCR